jgi:hypothetical protein
MSTPNHPYGADGSTNVGRDTPPSRTNTGADVTSRMSGTSDPSHDRHTSRDDTGDRGVTDTRDRTEDRGVTETRDRGVTDTHDRTQDRGVTDTSRRADYDTRVDTGVGRAKTSAAAAFALVFGLSALFCGLTGILAPVAVLFGIIGIILGVVGRKMALRPGVTGRGVATGGLVTAILGLLLGLAVIAGMAVYVNEQGLDGLQDRIDNARDSLPSGQDVVDRVPGS